MTMSGNQSELRYVARMAHTQIAPALRCESLGYERDHIHSASFQLRLAYLQ
jgi:hypothetical protein